LAKKQGGGKGRQLELGLFGGSRRTGPFKVNPRAYSGPKGRGGAPTRSALHQWRGGVIGTLFVGVGGPGPIGRNMGRRVFAGKQVDKSQTGHAKFQKRGPERKKGSWPSKPA